ncbi:MAG: helix-turn-helix transcriptional regulator [Alphaproteobacteria bacterium]|nr:helix-turn-helix transcriptional regulator [Alphaproteobacteria bacterium]
MVSHRQIWAAIDALAARHGQSPSGLARAAGLDATTFNPSKRTAPNGKLRWPSSESIAKILSSTGESFDAFAALVLEAGTGTPPRASVPLIGFAKAGADGYFDDSGFPTGGGWELVPAPGVADPHAFALKITGDSMEPVYRSGDVIIVSPGAQVRRGDRVVVKTTAGEVLAKILSKRTNASVTLSSFNPQTDDRVLAAGDILWMSRILWASQ